MVTSKQVTRRIQESAEYYERWCYLYIRLHGYRSKNKPTEVAEKYIDGHYLIWKELMSWMAGYNSGGIFENQQRDSAVKHFIGSWESWGRHTDTEFTSVNDLRFGCAKRHLVNTSSMLIQAIKYENFSAARLATDVLTLWNRLFSKNQETYDSHYKWYQEHITPSLLKYDDTNSLRFEIQKECDLRKSKFLHIALNNYWIDVRYLTAAYLMGSLKYRNSNIYKGHINSLLHCTQLEQTDSINSPSVSHLKPGDILDAYLRQSDCWEDKREYSAILEQHLDRLARIEEPDWISGRIRMAVRTRKDRYVPSFFKTVGIGLTISKFKLNRNWNKFLNLSVIRHQILESSIYELNKLTSVDESTIGSVCHQFNIDNEEAMKRRDLFIESIVDIITNIKNKLTLDISEAPIDEQKLELFGKVASGSTFTLSDGPILISFFHNIEYTDNFTQDLALLRIDNYPKSYVSMGIDTDFSINEDEVLNDLIEQLATKTAFQQLFKEPNWQEKRFETDLALISQVVSDSESIKSANLYGSGELVCI